MKPVFSIRLSGPAQAQPPATRVETVEYTEENDDIQSLLIGLCIQLDAQEGVHFVVEGFSDAPWPTSVRPDLCILLEQLPDITRAIDTHAGQFDLDFYEQGLQRRLHFERTGDDVQISCTNWGLSSTPDENTIEMKIGDLSRMFRAVAAEVVRLASMVTPELAAHPWFAQWRSEVLG
jgi:hypothetical protein